MKETKEQILLSFLSTPTIRVKVPIMRYFFLKAYIFFNSDF